MLPVIRQEGTEFMDLAAIRKIREKDVYPELFGEANRPPFKLQQEVFGAFGDVEVDAHWLEFQICEFKPTAERASWLYVTSGYSDPQGVDPADYNPNGESGVGVEFFLETEEKADWAIMRLQSLLAYDLLLADGQVDGEPLAFHDVIPLNHPVDGNDRCQIMNMVMIPPERPPEAFSLPSGNVMLAGFVGITNAERDFAAQFGMEHLTDKLRAAEACPVTLPKRESVV
ncbi:suppressor of fused domain protein [Loktanella sp. IMCC34160]|nr:suppressor of fused domain protein [Loktanella sp. IMCC34160]